MLGWMYAETEMMSPQIYVCRFFIYLFLLLTTLFTKVPFRKKYEKGMLAQFTLLHH